LKLGLLLRTLPHLRWEQLVYRPWRAAQFNCYRLWPGLTARWTASDKGVTEIPLRIIAAFHQVFERYFVHLRRPLAEQTTRWEALPDRRFTFLHRTLELGEPDWNRRYESHLWNYQLHYFDYAVWCARVWIEQGDRRSWQACQELIASWIARACIGRSDGWDAYPTSLRLVNWIYAYCLLAEQDLPQAFLASWRASIYRQLDFLRHHLEYHLLANHLLKNAKALVIGGLFFAAEKEGQRWLAYGQRLLWRELAEQVLADGGHYERTPMYHAQTLADWLECFALLRAFGSLTEDEQAITQRLQTMAAFLDALSYEDGTLALFNDSANTYETQPKPILAATERICGKAPNCNRRSFPQTGYFLWSSADGGEKLIVDAGPPSVAYNAGHAHCDLSSYELRLAGEPFIVDAGVHGYDADPFREYCRATRAHNTVMFDGREQSEVWGTFRMARRAEALDAEAEGDDHAWNFRGSYRPYYDRNLIHERRIQRRASGEWVVTDVALSERDEQSVKQAESFIHLHPEISTRRVPDSGLAVECWAGARRILIEPFGTEITVELLDGITQKQSCYFPDFGVVLPNVAINYRYRVRPGEAFGYTIKIINY
jgi:uncharacterized heparinase superfamily protein